MSQVIAKRVYEHLVTRKEMKSFRLKVDTKQPERLHHVQSYRI
jgi:hypothetical protein